MQRPQAHLWALCGQPALSFPHQPPSLLPPRGTSARESAILTPAAPLLCLLPMVTLTSLPGRSLAGSPGLCPQPTPPVFSSSGPVQPCQGGSLFIIIPYCHPHPNQRPAGSGHLLLLLHTKRPLHQKTLCSLLPGPGMCPPLPACSAGAVSGPLGKRPEVQWLEEPGDSATGNTSLCVTDQPARHRMMQVQGK